MVSNGIGFYLTVYRDEIWAHRLVRQIKTFYPEAPILITTDGPAHAPSLDAMEGATVIQFNRRLKVVGNGGLYTQRNVLAAVVVAEQHNVDIMIRVDPDSYLWRPFTYYPDSEWFGSTYNITSSLGVSTCCAGGCWGIRTPLLKRLAKSKILLDDRLFAKDISYARYHVRSLQKQGDTTRSRELIIKDGTMMGWAVNQLGVIPTKWDEVHVPRNGEIIQTPPFKYAVTHPVRSIP